MTISRTDTDVNNTVASEDWREERERERERARAEQERERERIVYE